MASERHIEEAVARCVSTIVYYQNFDPDDRPVERMRWEIQALAQGLRNLGVSSGAIEDQIVRPVEAEILARFGQEHGGLLLAEFAEAFALHDGVAGTH